MSGPARRAIVIGFDGASMELVKLMADSGQMPHVKRLLDSGVHRPMLGTYPTLTPPGWTALTTGSWPGTHGVMDFNIRALGKPLTDTVWGINTRLSKSEYLWNTAERAGKKPILVKWEMSWPPTVQTGVQVEGTGPGVANHHQIAGYHLFVGGKWAPRPMGGQRDPETVDPSALQSGLPYDPVALKPAAGWANLPESTLAPLEVELTVKPLARGNPSMQRGKVGTPRTYYALVYASGGQGYDRARITATRDAGDAIAELGAGQWSDWWRDTFVIDSAPVEGYVRMKLVALTPNGDQFELFVPQIWPTGGDWAVPAGVAEEIVTNVGPFIQNPARDAIGLIDDDTYFELLDFLHQRLGEVAVYLGKTREWDVLFIETHASDYTNHSFLGLADPISGASPEAIERCRRGVARTYASIDTMVGKVLELADPNTLVVLASDHGGTPSQFGQVDVNAVLEEAGFVVYRPGEGGKREVDLSKTKAFGLGLCHVFVNLKGREPNGVVDPADYEETQRQIVAALYTYVDKATGRHPFSLAITRQNAEMVNLWGDLVGDVVYALDPAFDGAHGKQLPSTRFGMGAQHSVFVMAGPGVKRGVALRRQVRVVDVAPTIAYLLGMPVPANAEGGVIYEALEDPDWMLNELSRLKGQG